MGPKKKKGQTLSLNTFLADSTYQPSTGKKLNWAEESEDPHGGADVSDRYGGTPMDLRNLPSAPRSSRAVDLDMSRLPSKPPYTAFLGNLPFDVTEDDIRNLFYGLKVDNIRCPQEQGRVKGFGYAEFYDLEDLKSALALSNEKIRTRHIRIDIADQAGKDQINRDGGRGGGMDDKTTGDWRNDDGSNDQDDRRDDRRDRRDDRRYDGDRDRRPAGLADSDDCWRKDDGPSGGREDSFGGRNDRYNDRGGGYNDRGGGYNDRGGGYNDRGGGYNDRGGGYNDRGGYRDDRGGGFRDDRSGGFRDDRGGGFRDDRGGGFRDDRGGGFRDDRGGGFRDDRRGGFRDDRGGGFRDDRGGGYRDGGRDERDGSRSDAPMERPKLNLKPRTVDPKPEEKTESAPAPSAQSSIFGNAKPVDTATKERLIEEKLGSMSVSRDLRRNDNDFRGGRDERDRDFDRDIGQGRSRDDAPYGDPRDNRFEKDRDLEFNGDGRRPVSREPLGNEDHGDSRSESRSNGHYNRTPYPNGERNGGHNGDGYSSPDLERPQRNGLSPVSTEPVSWRNEMKPNDINGLNNETRSEGDGKEKVRSPRGRRDDAPIIPPKYEEPAKPVFSHASRFAALGLSEDEGEGSGSDGENFRDNDGGQPAAPLMEEAVAS